MTSNETKYLGFFLKHIGPFLVAHLLAILTFTAMFDREDLSGGNINAAHNRAI